MKPLPRIAGTFTMRPLELAAWLVPVAVLSIAALAKHANDWNSAPAAMASCRVDLNAASLEELTTIPGMSPRRARALVIAREKRGGFERIADVSGVTGFTPGYVRRIEELVEVKK